MEAKKQERVAVYGGSFDPPTEGHMYMIREAAKLFDKVVVAIGINPDKKTTFTLEERLAMLKECTAGCPHVEIDQFCMKYLVKYAEDVGAQYVLRGLRNETDFGYEQVMRNKNQDISPNVATIFLMPPRELCETSSSMVKGLVGPEGWEEVVKPEVPEPVYKAMLNKYAGLRTKR